MSMNTDQWFNKVDQNREILEELIYSWHPVYKSGNRGYKITAAKAQEACDSISQDIRNQATKDPLDSFNEYLSYKDPDGIISILNEVWFGVPESTDCWHIPGFSAAVSLIEDPPE